MHSQKETRIQFLITGLEIGGAEVLLRDTVMRLKEQGYIVQVVSLTTLGPIGRDMQEHGVDVCAVGGGGKFDPYMVIRLFKAIRAFRPDILHAHLFHANLLGRIIGRLCGVPVIISTIHNIDFGGAFREGLLRYTDGLSTQTVTISERVRGAMRAKNVVPDQKLTTVDNGIDVERFAPNSEVDRDALRRRLDLPADKFLYLSVGRLMEQKGYPYLIEAVAQLVKQRTDVLFVILGEGDMRDELGDMVSKKGLQQYVQFRGNQSDVGAYMQVSDVFVMPSLWEGLPIALLEAMAYELPVVATTVGSIPDVVTEGESGLLVSERDTSALTAVLTRMRSLDGAAMGAHGRATIVEHFSIDTTVAGYVRLYTEYVNT